MSKPPRHVSSSSAASSTKPTTLHRPNLPHRRALSRSSSWSAWIPGSISRKLTPKLYKPGTAGEERKFPSADHLKLPIKADKGRKGSLRTPGSINRHKKSVTIEEPNDRADAEVASEAGTVRRGTTRSGVSSPKVVDTFENESRLPMSNGGSRQNGERHRMGTGGSIANLQDPENWRAGEGERLGHPKRQMRTVSRDDYLTGRGANPRTGLISPSISASQSDTSMAHLRQSANTLDKKWRPRGDQWVSLDTNDKTPLPTPPTDEDAANQLFIDPRDQAQAYVGQMSKSGVPLTTLEDRFVVNMPSAKEPSPPTMTPHQIIDFQRAIERVYRHNEEMVDPNTPPSPRVATPEGRSTPPKKLSKKNPLSFLKRRNSGFSKRQLHPASTPAPKTENTPDAEKLDSRQVDFAHYEDNQQNNGIETSKVPFLEDANATMGCQTTELPQPKGCPSLKFPEHLTQLEPLYGRENHPQQAPLDVANAVSVALKKPRADNLQGRRLVKNALVDTREAPVKLLSLEEGKEAVSSIITTTTTTSTNTTTTPAQKEMQPIVAEGRDKVQNDPKQQLQAESYFQTSDPPASAENPGAVATTTVELDPARDVVNENASQVAELEGMVSRNGRKVISLGGYTLTLETQGAGVKGLGIDSRLYLDVLALCLWLFVTILECAITLAMGCIRGEIWL